MKTKRNRIILLIQAGVTFEPCFRKTLQLICNRCDIQSAPVHFVHMVSHPISGVFFRIPLRVGAFNSDTRVSPTVKSTGCALCMKPKRKRYVSIPLSFDTRAPARTQRCDGHMSLSMSTVAQHVIPIGHSRFPSRDTNHVSVGLGLAGSRYIQMLSSNFAPSTLLHTPVQMEVDSDADSRKRM